MDNVAIQLLLGQYAIYLFRWQLSTPILAVIMARGNHTTINWKSAALANLVGGLLFFWFDRWLLCR